MKPEDLKIDIYRVGPDLRDGSNAVRITHIPSGIVIKSEEARDSSLNMQIALVAMEQALSEQGEKE